MQGFLLIYRVRLRIERGLPITSERIIACLAVWEFRDIPCAASGLRACIVLTSERAAGGVCASDVRIPLARFLFAGAGAAFFCFAPLGRFLF